MNLHSSNAAPAFHAGERTLQEAAGMAERMAQVGVQAIRDYLPQQHREFFLQLPFLIVGSIDATGQPTASILAAPPGFISSPDERTLQLAARADAADPLTANLRVGASLGLLGIQPHTRRRNRVNGIVTALNGHGFALNVQQSFGNCPKYIQAREAVFIPVAVKQCGRVTSGLDDQARRLITNADTFFIASAHADAKTGGNHLKRAEGVDVSHRGGRPGFVHISENDTITVPDYRGNFFFNTLGNLLLHPLAGLLFIDFDNGDLLQLDATAEIVTDGDALAGFPGAERLLHLRVWQTLWRPAALPLRWGPAEISPYL